MGGSGESSLGSMTAQEKLRMDAFMARVEAMELHDTPMDEEVSLLPVEPEVILNTSLKGKGKEKVEVSPILNRGSGCENGLLLNLDKVMGGDSRKDKRLPLNLKAALASQKSSPTKEAQTSAGLSGEVRPRNP